MATKLRAIYDIPANSDTNTPACTKGEILELLKRHDTGWLEVKTSTEKYGYVPPAWVEELPQEPPTPPSPAPVPTSPQPQAPTSPRPAKQKIHLKLEQAIASGPKPAVAPRSARLSTHLTEAEVSEAVPAQPQPQPQTPTQPRSASGHATPPTLSATASQQGSQGSVTTPARHAPAPPPGQEPFKPPRHKPSATSGSAPHTHPTQQTAHAASKPPSVPQHKPSIEAMETAATVASSATQAAPHPTVQVHDEAPTTLEMYLERKLVMEGGKESRKRQWTRYYTALDVSKGTVTFYNTKKEFEKGKKPVQVLDLVDKTVARAEDYSKREFVISIESATDKILLDCTSFEDMVDWLHPFNSAPPSPAISPASKRKSMAVEEFSDSMSTKEKTGFLRKKLAKFVRSRPQKQDLMAKGIIKYAVFGGTIELQLQRELDIAIVPNVPNVVVKCIERVSQSLEEPGIYRISGNAAEIQAVVGKVNEDVRSLNTHYFADVHAATGLLKLYFRELSEPVFTDEHYEAFIAAGKMTDAQDTEKRQSTLKSLIQKLPMTHRATLKFLFLHLQQVAELGQVNKMHTNNLAIVFGPTLLRCSEPSIDAIVMDSPFQTSVVEEIMINHFWLD
eukprot:m.33332 g.33332  ORF g.33332 m.33332 type:complete len:618 (+) comp9607_c1_seq2:199-2052(+)